MGIIIFLLILGGLYLYLSRDSEQAKREFKKGRKAHQKDAIRYFTNYGLLQKSMKDAEFEEMVMQRIKRTDFKQRALDKIGLDESELLEIEPFCTEGYAFDDKMSYFYRLRNDGIWVSSNYSVCWLFFSETEIHFYTYIYDTTSDSEREFVEGYFYKDVTSIMVSSDVEEVEIPKPTCAGLGKYKISHEHVKYSRFKLTVAGSSHYASISKPTAEIDRAIQGMKHKLREKKNA